MLIHAIHSVRIHAIHSLLTHAIHIVCGFMLQYMYIVCGFIQLYLYSCGPWLRPKAMPDMIKGHTYLITLSLCFIIESFLLHNTVAGRTLAACCLEQQYGKLVCGLQQFQKIRNRFLLRILSVSSKPQLNNFCCDTVPLKNLELKLSKKGSAPQHCSLPMSIVIFWYTYKFIFTVYLYKYTVCILLIFHNDLNFRSHFTNHLHSAPPTLSLYSSLPFPGTPLKKFHNSNSNIFIFFEILGTHF